MNGSVKEPNKFHNYETEKINSQSQWRGRIYRVVWFFHPRLSRTTHLMLFSEHPLIYALLCMMISGGRTEQLYIIAGFFLPHHWLYEWFLSSENVRRYKRRAWRSWVEEPNNT